ncbi:MAG: hypothetical protein JO265_00660 [Acidimicrobiia bacterium]|nr:hypothetical protein [Acidimicrobiia bacterium]
MTRDEWLEAFATAAGGGAPTAEDVDALLALAGIAAHASERTAAPITCWIAARAGLEPADALRLAESIRRPRPAAD